MHHQVKFALDRFVENLRHRNIKIINEVLCSLLASYALEREKRSTITQLFSSTKSEVICASFKKELLEILAANSSIANTTLLTMSLELLEKILTASYGLFYLSLRNDFVNQILLHYDIPDEALFSSKTEETVSYLIMNLEKIRLEILFYQKKTSL